MQTPVQLPTYERAFHSIPELVCVVDRDARVVMANSALTRVTGVRSGDDCPTKGLYCNCNGRCTYLDKSINQKIEINRNGRIYLVSMNPMRERDGSYRFLLQSWRDITGEIHLKGKLTAQNQGLRKDLDVARRLQSSMLMESLPRLDKIRFGSVYQTCEQVGGDFYDVFTLNPHRVAFYMADVSGHGVSAAMLTVFFAQAIRSIMQSSDDTIQPSQVLTEVWRRFVALGVDEYLYITAWMAILDSDTQQLTYCNAGHIASPILSWDSNYERLEVPGFPVCRWTDNPGYHDVSTTLPDGARVLLYTDGLSDAWRKNKDINLIESSETPDMIAIRHLIEDPFDQCVENIWNEITQGMDHDHLDDDVAMLLIGLDGD